MNNLIDIQSQIEKLQKQAQDIRSKDFASTVQDILQKMQAFGITVKDLQTAKPTKGGKAKGTKPGRAPTKKAAKSSNPVAAKFKGPNGEAWSGRGLMPKWLSALVAQGRTKDEFAV